MNASGPNETSLQQLVWLADAPLYIDQQQIDRFYDAVIMPIFSAEGIGDLEDTELGHRRRPTLSAERVHERTQRRIYGELEGQAGLTTGAVLEKLFQIGSVDISGTGRIDGEHAREDEEDRTLVFEHVDSPSRQLVQLALHYLLNHQDRIFFIDSPADHHWEDDNRITDVPRELVFIDFPGIDQAEESNLPITRLVPTAAEIDDEVVPLYNKLGDDLPEYKELDDIDIENLDEGQTRKEKLREEHRKYWNEFADVFRATKANRVVENAAAEYGRFQWIDFRVQLDNEGRTLHLHITPNQEYYTGVFAYNFIKRAYKHGIRIVGTLKTEPDLDVLAIYNK